MTPAQEAHLQAIKSEFARDVDIKYRNGAAEHGGHLEQMHPDDLLDEAIAEAVDLYTYLVTLRQKRRAEGR